MPLPVAGCPSFAAHWAAYSAESDFEPDSLYLHLAEFARHLIGPAVSGALTEFPAVFEGAERCQTAGEPFVRQAAVIGLLEAIRNNASWEPGFDAGVFRPYLGPEPRRAWDDLNRFRAGRGSSE